MKTRLILFAVLASTLTCTPPRVWTPLHPRSLAHGAGHCGPHPAAAGDSIAIDAIHGSADKIAGGNVYKMTGTTRSTPRTAQS